MIVQQDLLAKPVVSNMLTSIIKNQIIKIITKTYGKCSIYLFGSYAYGTPSLSSDLDIAVIMEKVESKEEKAIEIWKELEDIPMPKDIVVASQREYDFYKKEAGSIFRTIAQKVFYSMADDYKHQYEIIYLKAVSDIKIAKLAIDAKDNEIDDATILFHLQQAVE